MAQTFGEADVILRARLDVLQRELDAGERLVRESSERIAQAQASAAREVVRTQQDSGVSLGEVGVAALYAMGLWRTLGRVIAGVGATLRALPTLAAAAGAAMSAAAVGGVTALTLGVGLLNDALLRVRQSAKDVVEAFFAMDGSRQRALEFADALGQILIVGRAARQVFLMFSADAGMQTEAWARLVARIEDGQVKVGLLGRAINGLVNLSTPGIVARLLGFDTDLVSQIEEANRQIERMQAIMQVQGQAVPIGREIGAGAFGASRQAEREAILANLEGIERVRIEEQFRFEDAMRYFDELQRRSNEFHAQQVAEIRARAEEEGLGARRTQELIDAAFQTRVVRDAAIDMQREAAAQALNEAARRRIELAQQELAEQERIEAAEQRRFQAAQMSALIEMRAGTEAARARLGGQDFEAQRIELEASRRRAILGAMVEGHQEQLAAIQEFYDARAALIDAREREQMQRDQELAQRRELAQLQAVERLRSQILQERLRLAGDEVGARQEAIRQQFQELIDQFESEGNETAARLARQLRDIRIAAAANEEQEQVVRREGRAFDISFARVGPTDFTGHQPVRVEGQDRLVQQGDQQIRHLAQIEQNLDFE